VDETPIQREDRLAAMKEAQALERRMKRAKANELKLQSDEVRRNANMQDWLAEVLNTIEMVGQWEEDELPATTKARAETIDAIRRYSAELGTEIRTHWSAVD
jgi:hypothetical protein